MPAPNANTTEPQLLQSIPTLDDAPTAEQMEQTQAWGMFLWISGGIILAIGCAVVIILRRKKRELPPAPTPEETALRSIEALRTAPIGLRECCLELSMILRRYLSGSTQDPALYETHEEFSQRMDALSGIPAECQFNTRKLLESLAEYKYAGEQPNAPELAASLMQSATELISAIRDAQAKAAAAAAELEKMKKLS